MTDFIKKYLMPQKVLGFALSAREFLRGKKTYLAALVLLLQALLGYVEQLAALDSFGAVAEFVRTFAANDATAMLAQALALFGLRAAISKK